MSIWTDLWKLFFPQCCLICGKTLLEGEENLCFQCLSNIPRTHLYLRKDNEMEKELWGKFPIERASAYLYYSKGGDVKKLLTDLKYRGNADLGSFLGRCMTREMLSSGFFQGVDGIIPVPLHPRKQKIRGYNQSIMLANGISSVTNIPVWNDLLVRTQYTQTQTRKGSYERWLNVKDMFECTSPERLRDKHVLLVDDVFTTGATLVACADAFRQIPGLRFSVLTLAIATSF